MISKPSAAQERSEQAQARASRAQERAERAEAHAELAEDRALEHSVMNENDHASAPKAQTEADASVLRHSAGRAADPSVVLAAQLPSSQRAQEIAQRARHAALVANHAADTASKAYRSHQKVSRRLERGVLGTDDPDRIEEDEPES